MDEIDRRMLRALQRDGRPTAEELGRAVGLSPSQAARRRARLERDGVIEGYRARVSARAVGLEVQAMVQLETAVQKPDSATELERLLAGLPQVADVWTLTGDSDYLVRVRCRDLRELNRLVREVLLPHPTIARVRSQIVLEQPVRDAPLPIG